MTIYQIWATRPCFSCGRLGVCGHREIEVDQAILEAAVRDKLPAAPQRKTGLRVVALKAGTA